MAGIPAAVLQLFLPAQLALPALSLGTAEFCTCLGQESTGAAQGSPGSWESWKERGFLWLQHSALLYTMRILLPLWSLAGKQCGKAWRKHNRDVCLAEQDGERLIP